MDSADQGIAPDARPALRRVADARRLCHDWPVAGVSRAKSYTTPQPVSLARQTSLIHGRTIEAERTLFRVRSRSARRMMAMISNPVTPESESKPRHGAHA